MATASSSLPGGFMLKPRVRRFEIGSLNVRQCSFCSRRRERGKAATARMASVPREADRFGSARCLEGCGHQGGATSGAVGGTVFAPANVSASQCPVGVRYCLRCGYRRVETAAAPDAPGRVWCGVTLWSLVSVAFMTAEMVRPAARVPRQNLLDFCSDQVRGMQRLLSKSKPGLGWIRPRGASYSAARRRRRSAGPDGYRADPL